MTPRAAATAAGKRAAATSTEADRARRTDVPKRPGVRRPFAPFNPRRVSGPAQGREPRSAGDRAASTAGDRAATRAAARAAAGVGGRPAAGAAAARGSVAATATAAAAATVLAAAVEVAPRIVRPAPRIAQPAHRVVAPRRTRPGAPAGRTHGDRALAFFRMLPDHALTDRLVRGRAWIPVLGVLLAGIIAIQVSLLRLNSSMGRSIEQGATLQTENGLLRAQVASLGAAPRIERLAAGMGMVMANPQQVTFLSPHDGGIRRRAIADMSAPSASALAATQAAAATASGSTGAGTGAVQSNAQSAASSPAGGTALSASTQPPSTTAAGTSSTAPGAQPTGGAGAPTASGNLGTPAQPATGAPSVTGSPAAPGAPTVTGTTGSGQPSSGGAAYSAMGG